MTLHVSTPTTIPGLLGRELVDERELWLTTAPARVFREDAGGRTHYAVLIDAALDRRLLMDLLYTLAPYKAHGPDRFSRVLDNWALLERAQTSTTSENLMLQHAKSLKSHWHEFVRHRQAFVDVLRDQGGERRVTPLIAWSRDTEDKRRWELSGPRDELLRQIEGVRPGIRQEQLDALVGLVTIPYFLPELRRNWQAWQPLTKGGKSNYIGPASVPVIALIHRRALLNSKLVGCAEAYAEQAGD